MHCRVSDIPSSISAASIPGRAFFHNNHVHHHQLQALQRTCSTKHTVRRVHHQCTTAVLRNFTSHGTPRTERLIDTASMFFSEVFNSSNTAYLDEICSNDVVYCDSVWLPSPLKGRPRLSRYLNDLQHAYPDVLVQLVCIGCCVYVLVCVGVQHTTTDTPLCAQHSISCCDDGETVMAHWTIRGSNLRDYGGGEATGRSSAWSGVSVFRFDTQGDMITSIRVYREPTEEERAFYMGWDSL